MVEGRGGVGWRSGSADRSVRGGGRGGRAGQCQRRGCSRWSWRSRRARRGGGRGGRGRVCARPTTGRWRRTSLGRRRRTGRRALARCGRGGAASGARSRRSRSEASFFARDLRGSNWFV